MNLQTLQCNLWTDPTVAQLLQTLTDYQYQAAKFFAHTPAAHTTHTHTPLLFHITFYTRFYAHTAHLHTTRTGVSWDGFALHTLGLPA